MEQLIFNQEMARVNAPLLVNRVGILLVGPTLIEIGSEEQKQRFLQKILTGEEVWCQGFSEPNAGSDLANLRTGAERTDDGWVVDGQKIWTSYAHYADWCFLLARTDTSGTKYEGITALMVPMDQEGVDVEPIQQIDGERDFNQVYFDGATTAASHVVGEVDEGWDATMTMLSFEHGLTQLYPPDKLSLEERWADLVEYCQETTRNDRPLSEEPRIRQRLAELHTKIQAGKLMNLRYIQDRMASGEAGAKGSADRVFSSELLKELEEFALRIQGPKATLWEDGLEDGRWQDRYLDSFGTTIAAGTSEMHRNTIAERVLGLPKDPKD
jgi:alkylation response protein AidB-like acyl-CoA dehydrogenase